MVDHLQSTVLPRTKSSALCFDYCSYTDESSDTTRILRSLVAQIIRQVKAPEQGPAMSHFRRSDEGTIEPTLASLFDLFLALLEELDVVYVCLDAVDECQDEERQILLKNLSSLADRTNKIKIALFCRVGDYLTFTGTANYEKIEITRERVAQDLKSYVRYRIDNGPERLKRARSEQMIRKLIQVQTECESGIDW